MFITVTENDKKTVYCLRTTYQDYQLHKDLVKNYFFYDSKSKVWHTEYFTNAVLFITNLAKNNIPCKFDTETGKYHWIYRNSKGTKPSPGFENALRKYFKPEEISAFKEYQKLAAEFLLRTQKCFLADDMGLGKTAEVILAISTLAKKIHSSSTAPTHMLSINTCIVCPAHLKLNWLNELKNFLLVPATVVVLNRNKEKNYIIGTGDPLLNIYIINYEMLEKSQVMIEQFNPKVFVFDESHYLKNYQAKRTKTAKNLVKTIKPKYVWLLTGTPVTKDAMDLFTQLVLINHPLSQNWGFFAKRYAGAYQETIRNRKVWRFSFSNTKELKEILYASCMLRRTKDHVLSELPEKNRQIIILDPEEVAELVKREKEILKAYEVKFKKQTTNENNEIQIIDRILDYPDEIPNINKLSQIRQELALAKIPAIVALIQNILQEQEKVVIFAWHRTVISELKNALLKIYKEREVKTLTGEETQKTKERLIHEFQEDDNPKILICSIAAVATGVTLTRASSCVFAEVDWIPANVLQAEDRLHRLGQKHTVDIYYMVYDTTLESYIVKRMTQRKGQIMRLLAS